MLLPGDLMDDTVDAYLKENMKPHLQKLTAPMGVYATLGIVTGSTRSERIKHELEAAGLTGFGQSGFGSEWCVAGGAELIWIASVLVWSSF